jgi:hypothetical protein
MAPLKWLLAFLLIANTLASVFTTISTKGRTVMDAKYDAALKYGTGTDVSVRPYVCPSVCVCSGK